jgi:hypothetical protein
LLDGDGYVYPVVTKQGAIRGGGTGGGGGGGGNGSHVNATDGHGSGSVIFDGGVGGIGVRVGTTAIVAGLVLGFAALT